MSLEFNKAAAAVLTAGIVAMGAGFLSRLLVQPEPLHEDAYPVAVAGGEEQPAGGVAAEPKLEPVLALLVKADPSRGEQVAKACTACHSFEKGGPNKVGPNLWNVVGAPIAAHEGFNYSEALREKQGETWDYQALNAFIAHPREFAPGTRMSYGGLGKAEARADLIAWLRTLSDNPQPLPSEEEVAAATEQQGAEREAAGAQQAAGEQQAAGGEQQAAAGGGDLKAMIAAAGADAGAAVARKCQACHSFEEGGPNKVGPNLYDVIGAAVGHREDYSYSAAFKEKREAGATWTYEMLAEFLTDPRGAISGTKMSFAGLKKEEEVAAILAYMREHAENPPPLE